MNLQCYAVFDAVSRQYGNVILKANDDLLLRDIKEMFALDLNNHQNMLVVHANDMTLYRIGSYDTDNGVLFPEKNNFVVCRLGDIKQEVINKLKKQAQYEELKGVKNGESSEES